MDAPPPDDETLRGTRRAAAAAASTAHEGCAFERVGTYLLLRPLGRGGMGEVYEARQESPRRIVALKVLRADVASYEVLARFQREAQVLGQLEHPGIAQVYEAGVADTVPPTRGGIPFIAMELVQGVPLTEHAEREKLSTPRRLELLASLCDAVHHAHSRGFVHRDLKPSNVLVTADGRPKVLDFGVARASGADVTLCTEVGTLVGTIPYMSPEQASGRAASVDSRSDVYALGVLAYQLLAGRLPYDLSALSIPEATLAIAENEPSRLGSLDRAWRGDVEVIVAKALEKEPARRYQSAAEMGTDIRRHLRHEPIVARAPSATYQLAKFALRHRAFASAAVLGIVALVVALVLVNGARRREAAERASAQRSEAAALEAAAFARREAYAASLAAALAALGVEDGVTASARLASAPEEYRGFEWRMLAARLDDSLRSWPLPARAFARLAWSSDGALVLTHHPWELLRAWKADDGSLAAECSLKERPNVVDAACRDRAAEGTQLHAGEASLSVFVRGESAPIARLERLPTSSNNDQFHLDSNGSALLVARVSDGARSTGGILDTRTGRVRAGWGGAETWNAEIDPSRPGLSTRVAHDFAGSPIVHVLDLATSRTVEMRGHADYIVGLDWSRDGRLVYSASADRTARSWDPATGSPVATSGVFASPLADIAMSPDGKRLAACTSTGSVHLLDPASLVSLGTVRSPLRGGAGLAWSPDSRTLAACDERQVVLLPAGATEEPFSLRGHGSYVYAVASRSGLDAAWSVAWDGTVRSWSTTTLTSTGARRVAGEKGLTPQLHALAVDAQGRRIAVADNVGGLLLLDAATLETLAHARPADKALSLAFLADGRLVAGRDDLAVELDGETLHERARWTGADFAAPGAGSGQPLAIGAGGRGSDDASRCAFPCGGGRLLVFASGSPAPTLMKLDRENGGAPLAVEALAWSPRGDELALAGDGRIVVVDARDGRVLRAGAAGATELHAATWQPGGARIAVGAHDGSLTLFDAATLVELARIPAHPRYVHDLAWSRGGTLLLTASGDGTIGAWDERPRREVIGARTAARDSH